MQDLPFYYIPTERIRLVDIVTYKVGKQGMADDPEHYSHEWTEWIEKTGEVIMKIECEDGICYLIRKDFCTKNE